jgi:hypothetical protein
MAARFISCELCPHLAALKQCGGTPANSCCAATSIDRPEELQGQQETAVCPNRLDRRNCWARTAWSMCTAGCVLGSPATPYLERPGTPITRIMG